MKRTECAGLLLLFVLALSREAPADPLVDRAEAFRAELAGRSMIVGRDPELGSARAVAHMAKQFHGMFEFKRCGLQGVEDTPNRVERHAINTFAVTFRAKGDRACDGFKDRAACEYLRNNCVTLGNSIFCDYDYLYILRNLARASYAWAHLMLSKPGTKLEKHVFLPFSPDLLIDYAVFQAGPKPSIEGSDGGTGLSPSLRAVVGYAQKFSSVLGESAEFAVVNAVIGHEMAHVESNTCQIGEDFAASREDDRKRAAEVGISLYSKGDERAIAAKYVDMTCHRTLSQAELTADLRGVGMLGNVLWWQHMLWQRGYADADKDPAVAELWRLKGGIITIALAQALEYQLLMLSDPRAAVPRVRSEPKAMENQAMYAHYRRMGSERVREEATSGAALRAQRHMHASYRAGLLLKAAGLPGLYERRRQIGFEIGFPVRLYGYLRGSLEALQKLGCSRDAESAGKRARDFLSEISGVREGEYLID